MRQDSGREVTRRAVLKTALAGGVGLAVGARPWLAQAGTPGRSVLLDGFEGGLGLVNGAPRWAFVEVPGNTGTATVQSITGILPGGQSVLKVVCLTNKPGEYDIDVDFQPWTNGQGDSYAWEKASEASAYVPGTFYSLEFWMLPDSQYNPPATTAGGYAELTFGTYTMAPSMKFIGGSQESGGFHGYHSLRIPRTNGRWIKCKMMRPQGFRQGWASPAAICFPTSGNGVAFQPMETIRCSPSGCVLKFTHEARWPGVEGSPNVLWGLWTSRTAANKIPRAGDTLTGETSGAVRTINAASQYVAGNYQGGHNMDACGIWTGYSDAWIQQGGCTLDWASDHPRTTYWDRVTRFYIGVWGQAGAVAPVTTYMDDFRFFDDARDDQVAVSNIGGYFDPQLNDLFVTWQRNSAMINKQWEIRVAYADLHNGGLSTGTVWKTVQDSGDGYHVMSAYGRLDGTNGRPLFVSVRPTDRSTFAQIMLPTASSSMIAPLAAPGNLRIVP